MPSVERKDYLYHTHVSRAIIPMSTLKGDVKPIKAENPVLDQPPLLLNSSKTCGCARGAMAYKGMMTTEKPARWRIRIRPSIRGRREASTALKITEKARTAIDRRRRDSFPHIALYVQNYQTLDDGANHKTFTGKVNLPACSTKPA